MEKSIIISTGKAHVICFENDDALKYCAGMIDGAIETQSPLTLRIEHRTAAEVKRFLAGDTTPKAPAAIEPSEKSASTAPKTKPAAGKSAPVPGGHRKKTTSLVILECIAKGSGLTQKEVKELTGLEEKLVSVHVSTLKKNKRIRATDERPAKYFAVKYVAKPPAQKPEEPADLPPLKKKENGPGVKINCLARDMKITAADCVPNPASKWCRGCENVAA